MNPSLQHAGNTGHGMAAEFNALVARLQGTPAGIPDPSAEGPLAALATAFSLTPFERSVLALLAGVELEPAVSRAVAAFHQDPTRTTATVATALATLPDPHWSAFSNLAPLRRWRLIATDAGPLTHAAIRLDERVLLFLLRLPSEDERLRGIVRPGPPAGPLSHRDREAARDVARLLGPGGRVLARFESGHHPSAARRVAVAAAGELGLGLAIAHAADLPSEPAEREALARLWERECVLGRRLLLLETHDADPALTARAAAFLDLLEAPAALSGPLPQSLAAHRAVPVELHPPDAEERRGIWTVALGPAAEGLESGIEAVAGQFAFSAAEIHEAVSRFGAGSPDLPANDRLWKACRTTARERLEPLAQRLESRSRWDDLVLPDVERAVLREIALHVRHRRQVLDRWGFAARGSRGLGLTALFAGPSGTGKTLAAEVLAQELDLDLHRIDLSSIVSKYIGETEKNLARVFDAADAGGALLLFDEADALFGRRSEVKDSHDRYANIEVGFLLQRMESYRGLAILTTNQRSALDPAFVRRLRFIITFPFPDPVQRAEIWRRAFPAATPTDRLDPVRLAQLNVSGGHIRNIALHAAFLAAEAGEPVRMTHLATAAEGECAKLERLPTEAELAGWT